MRKKWNYEREMERARQKKEVFDQRAEIRAVKRSMRRWKLPTTTKLLMAFIFLNCSVVEIYSMWVMWALADLSSLYALITAVVTESLSFAVYCAKAYNETKQEEMIKLERDRMALDHSSPEEDGMDENADPENNEGGEEAA